MPKKALRPCLKNGCPALTDGRYCPDHQPSKVEERPSSTKRGYGRNWQKLRRMVLARRPVCADPFGIHKEQNSGGVLATDVDHIVPKAMGGSDAMDNLQPLCHSCHSRKTALESSGWGDRGV